jgi:hypothetical protein
MAGLALLVVLTLAGTGVARAAGFSPGRILRCLLGALVGGGVGAAPGLVCLLLAAAGSASGASPVPAWPAVLLAAGGAAGTLAGLRLTDRGRPRPRFPGVAWATALAGLGIGVAASFLALLLVQNTDSETAWMVLSPLATAAATVAGYALAAPKPSGRAETAG